MHPNSYNPKIEAGKIASEARWGKGSMREMWKVRGDVVRNTSWTLKTRVKSKKGKKLESINQSIREWWVCGGMLVSPGGCLDLRTWFHCFKFKFNIALNNNGPCVCGYILSSMAESHLLDNIEIQVNANLTTLPHLPILLNYDSAIINIRLKSREKVCHMIDHGRRLLAFSRQTRADAFFIPFHSTSFI